MIIWFLGVILYLAIGTLVGAKLTFLFTNKSKSSYFDISDAAFAGFSLGVVWPIGMCVLLGSRILDREFDKAKQQEAALKERERAVKERERILAAARRELEDL